MPWQPSPLPSGLCYKSTPPSSGKYYWNCSNEHRFILVRGSLPETTFSEPDVVCRIYHKVGCVDVVALHGSLQELGVVNRPVLLQIDLLVLCYSVIIRCLWYPRVWLPRIPHSGHTLVAPPRPGNPRYRDRRSASCPQLEVWPSNSPTRIHVNNYQNCDSPPWSPCLHATETACWVCT